MPPHPSLARRLGQEGISLIISGTCSLIIPWTCYGSRPTATFHSLGLLVPMLVFQTSHPSMDETWPSGLWTCSARLDDSSPIV